MENGGTWPPRNSSPWEQPAGQPQPPDQPVAPQQPLYPWQQYASPAVGEPTQPPSASRPLAPGPSPFGGDAPTLEQPGYGAYPTPPAPATPPQGAAGSGNYAPPSYGPQGGYGAYSSPTSPSAMGYSAPPSMPYYPPAPPAAPYPVPAPPQRQGSLLWLWITLPIVCVLLICGLLLTLPGLAVRGNVGASPTTTPYGYTSNGNGSGGSGGSTQPTATPYPTDTPYPTATPVSYTFSTLSYNMQMGTGYGRRSDGTLYVTGATVNFHAGDPYAALLQLNHPFNESQLNFILLSRTTPDDSKGVYLYTHTVEINPSDAGELWHDSAMSNLMGSEPPGQYEIRITDSQYSLGYVDFNYYG